MFKVVAPVFLEQAYSLLSYTGFFEEPLLVTSCFLYSECFFVYVVAFIQTKCSDLLITCTL